jgi:nitronate monooxygenase
VAALALGADGMNMGTRFVATQEAPVHENVKQAIVNAGERDTCLLLRSLRNTIRVMKNSVTDQVLEIESKGNTQISDIAHLVGGGEGREVLDTGDMEKGIVSVGQVAGLVRSIPTVQELIEEIVSEACEIMTSKFGAVLSGD